MKRYFTLLALLLVLVACRASPPITPTTAPTPAATLAPVTPVSPEQWDALDPDALFAQIFAQMLRRDPEWATELGLADAFGIPQDELTNVSPAYQEETYQLAAGNLARLQALDPATLTPAQRVSRDIYIWLLDDQVRGHDFALHDYPVNQVFGIQNSLPTFMAYVHPLRHLPDAQDYVARLAQVGVKFDQAIVALGVRADAGMIPPRFVFDRVLAEMGSITGQPAAQSLFYAEFHRRLQELDNISAADKETIAAAALAEVENTVYPAYDRLAATLRELRQQATTDDGVWKLPNGDAYYAYALRHHTSTDLTAAEIHALGLQEVARIQEEMRDLLAAQGFSTDLARGTGQMYQAGGGISIASQADRDAAIAAYQSAMDRGMAKMDAAFNLRPRAALQIVPVPDFRGGGSLAYYNAPPVDGSRPGYFSANLSQGRFISFVELPTLAYHEGVPGHHFQLSIQVEETSLPTFRRATVLTGFAEGWALYAERLAADYGVYTDDPYGDYGRLQAELFRAVRLVLDTGIHAQGWTRQQAIDYFVQTMNWPESVAVGEVERYIVWPGQAVTYKVGQLTLLRLRDQAQTALGGDFDIAAFHDLILQNGSVPFPILEELVTDWVTEQ